MEKNYNNYQMFVNQINTGFFRLKLVKTDQANDFVVFETVSSTIPLTRELIGFYEKTSKVIHA